MTQRVWDEFLTEQDKKVFEISGYGARSGLGKRPALLVIDMTYGFTGDRPEPILRSIKRWPNSSGLAAWSAIAVIRTLLDKAHAKGLPVFYCRNAIRDDGWDWGGWHRKSRRTAEWTGGPTNLESNAFVADIAPLPQDIVIGKTKPSAFFGTPLISQLTQLGADTLVVTGNTTSGCVRAAVIDAFSYNLHVAVVEDGCFDRAEASHAINLCDMNAKYADVISGTEIIAYFDGLDAGMFRLPSGAGKTVP
ncbi:MAG: isochorismatase family protein [Alphaproteobacteria bacterium]|nr:isochorismatase family protein [Alphaproteobacteria bacterium]